VPDFLLIMWKPLLACLLLAGIHAYLGFHVIERGVIFVDLALAQIAALGASAGFFFGFGLHSEAAYLFSLGAAFTGAFMLAVLRTRRERIPQEAVIGIIYAFSAAASVLVLSRAPEGDEHIRHMLVGNILLVSWDEIIKMAVLYSVIGLIHWIYRTQFLLISTDPAEAERRKINVKKWDFIFYVTFALVVTSSVEIAGVLLVFSFLIVPSAVAMLFARKAPARLALAWLTGLAGSAAGIAFSYSLDLPTGAAVICSFGLIFFLASTLKLMAFR